MGIAPRIITLEKRASSFLTTRDAWNNTAFGEEEYQAKYDEERDAFCFCDGGLEEWDCFGAQTIETDSKTIKVYPIGAFCWTWSDAEGR
jgi:hypothetical protein